MFVFPPGVNFSSERCIPAMELACALNAVVRWVQDNEPCGATLLKFRDWIEHNGLHFAAGQISFHDLFEIVDSPKSLLEAALSESTYGEESVFIGISNAAKSWYLRFYVAWDEEGLNLIARFDMTVPAELAVDFRKNVASQCRMKEEASESYSDRLFSRA